MRSWKNHTPILGCNVYIDPDATVIGTVVLEDEVSIWPRAVIRGDVNLITIGAYTNIQDGAVLHTSRKTAENPQGSPLIIGKNVTVGHLTHLHGCKIGNFCLIGSATIVLDEAILDEGVLLAAGSLVPPGKHLKAGLWRGSPAEFIRPLHAKEITLIRENALHYKLLKDSYMEVQSG